MKTSTTVNVTIHTPASTYRELDNLMKHGIIDTKSFNVLRAITGQNFGTPEAHLDYLKSLKKGHHPDGANYRLAELISCVHKRNFGC